MATQPVPTLSANGWISDPYPKADAMMAWYLVSEASQSNLYVGSITSLASQLQRCADNPTQLKQVMTSELEAFFAHNFDYASVDVDIDYPTSATDGRLNVKLAVTVTQDGVNISVGAVVSHLNGKVVEIFNYNTNGNAPLST